MATELLRQNWAVFVAAVLLLILAVIACAALYRRSASYQLRRTAKGARIARTNFTKAKKTVVAAEKRMTQLQGKAASVKPRVLEEAKESLADARSLEKIAGDQVLVAANHLRRVIYQEYSPSRHEALRRKYLPDDTPDTKPFSF